MFKITIPKPLYVPGNKLPNDLLRMLAPAGATVEFEMDTVLQEPGAQNVQTAPEPATPYPTPPAATADAKRRGRPPKVAETPAPTAAPKPDLVNGASEPLDRSALLEEFTKLVDADYDKALEVLTKFSVTRFSDLSDEQLPAFAAAMR